MLSKKLSKKHRVLILARGKMNADETVFWDRVNSVMLERGSECILLVHHEPETDCAFQWKLIPNMLSQVKLPELDSSWMNSRASDLPHLRDKQLLELESLWRSQPTSLLKCREKELALFCVKDLLREIMSEVKPSLVVIWNGRHAIEEALADIARAVGCNLAWLERGPFPGTLQLDDKGILADSSVAKIDSWEWHNADEQKRWLETFEMLRETYNNGATSWWAQPDSQGGDTIRQKLGIADDKRIVVFFGQVDKDSQNLFFAPRFEDNLSAWKWLSDALKEEKDLFVVGKHHPKSRCKAAEYQSVVSDIENASWVEDISVNDAMEIADLVVAVNSSTLYEGLMRNIPALALGNSLLSNKSIAYNVKDIETPLADILKAITANDLKPRLERFRDFGAYLLANHLVTMRPEQETLRLNSQKVFAERLVARINKNADYSDLPKFVKLKDPILGETPFRQVVPPMTFNPVSTAKESAGPVVVFSTFDPFWQMSMGSHVRNSGFIKYLLSQPIRLHLLYTGVISSDDIENLRKTYPNLYLHATNTVLPGFSREKQNKLLLSQKIAKYADRIFGPLWRGINFCAQRPPFDRIFDNRGMGLVYRKELRPRQLECSETLSKVKALLETIAPDFVIPHGLRQAFLHKLSQQKYLRETKWIMDTVDIQSARSKSLHKYGVANGISISKNEECDILRDYDAILAISDREKNDLQKMLPNKLVLTAKHAAQINNIAEPETENIIVGIISTSSHKNIEALSWFLENVWIDLKKQLPSVEMYVFGSACKAMRKHIPKGVTLKGTIDDVSAAFPQFHIAINPIRSGAGLQIKSVESMSYGRPLVTTDLGGEGLMSSDGKGALIAETPDEWRQHLIKLISEPSFRQKKSQECIDIIKQNFSADAAFHEVVDFMA